MSVNLRSQWVPFVWMGLPIAGDSLLHHLIGLYNFSVVSAILINELHGISVANVLTMRNLKAQPERSFHGLSGTNVLTIGTVKS